MLQITAKSKNYLMKEGENKNNDTNNRKKMRIL